MTVVFAASTILGFGLITLPILFNVKSSKSLLYAGISIVILSVALMGAFKEPPRIYDIYRHYLLINKVRDNGWSVPYAVFKGIPWSNINYKYTYLYNLIIVFIAKCLPNGTLPFLSALTYYSIFAYVFFKEFKGRQQNGENLLFSMLLCSAMMPYLYVYSGIRNNMGVSIAALGVYRYFKVSHNLIEALLIILLGALIHPIAIVSLIVLLTYRFRPHVMWLICIVLFPIILDPIMEWCRLSSGNDFLFRIGAKYYNYTKVREDDQGRVFLYCAILLILMWCLMLLIKSYERKQKNDFGSLLHMLMKSSNRQFSKSKDCQFVERNDGQMATGIWWYTILSLAFMHSYSMMIRFPYLLGCLSPFFVRYIMGDSLVRRKLSFQNLVVAGSTFGLAILILYENIGWLAN